MNALFEWSGALFGMLGSLLLACGYIESLYLHRSRRETALLLCYAAGAVVYLGLHGVLKLAMVLALLRKWIRAYPVVVAVLVLFVAYELYRAFHTGSIVLPVLAAIDLAIIVMVIREYRMLRGA